jgi:hypothetical protein
VIDTLQVAAAFAIVVAALAIFAFGYRRFLAWEDARRLNRAGMTPPEGATPWPLPAPHGRRAAR